MFECHPSVRPEMSMVPLTSFHLHQTYYGQGTTEMECSTATALLDDYTRATTEYCEVVDKLSNLVGSHDEFAVAKRYTEQVFAKCHAVRLAMQKHRADHNCGG
jgi:hypothetical protein